MSTTGASDDLRAFWRSLAIQNDAIWARLQDGTPGAAAKLHGAHLTTVEAVLKASPDRVAQALPGITPGELQEIRTAARAWLRQAAETAETAETAGAEPEPAQAQGVNNGGTARSGGDAWGGRSRGGAGGAPT